MELLIGSRVIFLKKPFSGDILYTTVCITSPLERFSKLDCSTTNRVPMPNDTSSESSWRDVSYADLFRTSIILTVEISTMKIGPGVCGVHRIVR